MSEKGPTLRLRVSLSANLPLPPNWGYYWIAGDWPGTKCPEVGTVRTVSGLFSPESLPYAYMNEVQRKIRAAKDVLAQKR
jgi:hypothetical protein